MDRFLEEAATHHTANESEQTQALNIDQALNVALPAEVGRVLPILLRFTHRDNDPHARGFAEMFLLGIAIRPDGGELLSSSSRDISSLLVDPDPGIQKGAVAITDFIIGNPKTDKKRYLSALLVAMQNPQGRQDVLVQMTSPLLTYSVGDKNATKAVLDFLHRNDLTESTRLEILHNLGDVRNIPREVRQWLVNELDNSSLGVRAAAVIAFSNSYLGYDPLAKDRVEKMVEDPKEDPRLRALAREALAGHSPLNPNINLKPYNPL